MVVIEPEKPKAAVVLFAGGHGGLQISSTGDFKWGERNFLVRTRRLFSSNGLMVAVVDAPSDRQKPPYLRGFRQTPEHVADIRAVIAWVRQRANIPVWPVPDMSLDKIQIPTFVAHHKRDGCDHRQYGDISRLMEKLTNAPRKELLTLEGGKSHGDPCEAMAYHGFNDIEQEVVKKITDWIVEKNYTKMIRPRAAQHRLKLTAPLEKVLSARSSA